MFFLEFAEAMKVSGTICLDSATVLTVLDSDAELVLRLLDLLQGTVLLHPASRRLFARTGHMAVRLVPQTLSYVGS